MENKYYTPLIEEFHVGFEYEYLTVDGKWVKDIFMSIKPEDTEQMDLSIVESILKNHSTELKVKYLDKEDIESLGFVLISEEIKTYSHWCQFKNNEIQIHVQLNEKYFPRLLNISSMSKGKYIGNFKIDIKNKSELKVLMKQLNIIK
jgi:hypothetical protein